MRLVIDTNVFVSAALKQSSWPAQIIRWVDVHGGLLKTEITEMEVFEVLQRPRIAPKILPSFVGNLRRVFAAAEYIAISEQIVACRDPKDDRFLELAVSGGADIIVSGDADLLVIRTFRSIPILAPAAFGRLHMTLEDGAPGSIRLPD